jgi:predicted porin
MKIYRVIAITIITQCGSSLVNAQGPIDGAIYDKININAELASPKGGDDKSDIVSNASRLGFEGATLLREGLEVIYQIEYEVNIDDGDRGGDTLNQRDSFLGLKGSYGTILMGKHDTPTKMTQNRLDLFNDMIADLRTVLPGENRENDIILYTSPEYSGFTANIATIAGGDDEDFSSSYSASLAYRKDSFYLALGVDSNVANHDIVRFVTQYFAGPLTVGALYQRSENTRLANAEEEDGVYVSASYRLQKFTLKAQFGESDAWMPGNKQFTTGFDYSLGERTRLFTYYSSLAPDNEVLVSDYFGIGIEHIF